MGVRMGSRSQPHILLILLLSVLIVQPSKSSRQVSTDLCVHYPDQCLHPPRLSAQAVIKCREILKICQLKMIKQYQDFKKLWSAARSPREITPLHKRQVFDEGGAVKSQMKK